MNVSVKGGGSVLRHWLDLLRELLYSGLLTQTEMRIIRAVLNAFKSRSVSGGKPKIKGVLDSSHIIALRAMSKRIKHDIFSPAVNTAANEVEQKIK
jgi:hypothetical protein